MKCPHWRKLLVSTFHQAHNIVQPMSNSIAQKFAAVNPDEHKHGLRVEIVSTTKPYLQRNIPLQPEPPLLSRKLPDTFIGKVSHL
jgi:hypothetical protein